MLFKKKPADPTIANLEVELAGLRARYASLSKQFTAAEAELASALATRRSILSGDSDPSDKTALPAIDQRIAAAERNVSGLRDALQVVGGRIDSVEDRLATSRLQNARDTEASAAIAEADALAAALDRHAAIGAELLPLVEAGVARIRNCAPDYLPRISVMITTPPLAGAELVGRLRDYAASVAGGSVTLGRPVVIPAPEPAPVIERKQLFAVSNICWREGAETKVAAKYSFCSPPLAAAETALARDLAREPENPTVASMVATFGTSSSASLQPSMCTDLDKPIASAPATGLPPGVELSDYARRGTRTVTISGPSI